MNKSMIKEVGGFLAAYWRRVVTLMLFALAVGTVRATPLPPAYKFEFLQGRDGGPTTLLALNNHGEILGQDELGYYIYDGTNYVDVPAIPGVHRYAYYDFNDARKIVGSYESTPSSGNVPIVRDGDLISEPVDLPSDTSGRVFLINNADQVSGDYFIPSPTPGTTFFHDGTTRHDVAYPGAHATLIRGMNDDGELVGVYSLPAATYDPIAFRGTPGNLETLDAPLSLNPLIVTDLSINNWGQIAMTHQPINGGSDVGLLIDGDLTREFVLPGAYNTQLFDINDGHQIIGSGRTVGINDGKERPFLATPVAPYPIGVFSEARAGVSSIATSVSTDEIRGSLGLNFDGTVYVETDTLTPESLAGTRALLLPASKDATDSNLTLSPVTPLTADEQQTLLDYVKSGGGAIIALHGQLQFAETNASFLDIFGMAFQEHDGSVDWLTVPDPSDHPVTDGPFGLVDQKSRFLDSGWFTDLGPYAQGLGTLDANGETALAVIEPGAICPGSGAVVFYGSVLPLVYRYGSEETLLLNSMQLVSVPEPASIGLLATSLIGLLIVPRRRRRIRAHFPNEISMHVP